MQTNPLDSSLKASFVSPVEERHIDYLLEEAFLADSDFLPFFLRSAGRSSIAVSGEAGASMAESCRSAVRSVSNEVGETDLLVLYASDDTQLPKAILIEDKIRAGFQPEQAERYRQRGEAGLGKHWSGHFTCLVAHSKFAHDGDDFDAVVTLETLQAYFKQRMDPHSQFAARVLQQTVSKFETTGIKVVHEGMTRFRASYAAEFNKRFASKEWWHQPARLAWWDDTWFECRRHSWAKGVKVVHQARPGRVQLVLPFRDEVLFTEAVSTAQSYVSDSSFPKVAIAHVGKTKSSFQVAVSKVKTFSAEDFDPEEAFTAIEFLDRFYQAVSKLLPESLRVREPAPAAGDPADSKQRELTALQAMIVAFMRSTVTRYGTAMPFPLPDVREMAAVPKEDGWWFQSAGMMGGFKLRFVDDESGVHILSDHWSRQWSESLRHRIGVDEVRALPTETFDWQVLDLS